MQVLVEILQFCKLQTDIQQRCILSNCIFASLLWYHLCLEIFCSEPGIIVHVASNHRSCGAASDDDDEVTDS